MTTSRLRDRFRRVPSGEGLPYIAVTENLPLLLNGQEPTQTDPSEVDATSTTTENF